jgi:hypothetical protein
MKIKKISKTIFIILLMISLIVFANAKSFSIIDDNDVKRYYNNTSGTPVEIQEQDYFNIEIELLKSKIDLLELRIEDLESKSLSTGNNDLKTYSCASRNIYDQNCPFGLSEGIGTRCYLNEEKNNWFNCKEGWV